MKYRKFGNDYILRLDPGDEIIKSIRRFALDEQIVNASINGIGAINRLVIGLYDLPTKKYNKKEFCEAMEITTLLGNISLMDGKTYTHIHINASDSNMNVYGGHLDEAWISATAEIFVHSYDEACERIKSSETGINIYDF